MAKEATMSTITDSFTIARPLAEVFAYVSDFEHLPEWARGVQRVSRTPAGPTRAGTIFQVTGKMGGRELTAAYRIEACEADARLSASGQIAFLRFAETFSFEAVDGGTRVSLRNAMEPQGLAKLGTPLWAAVLGRQIRGDNARLKRVLEAGAGTAAP
jgi:uncharacterized protein YndB with AHSA1/START domain